MPKRIALLLLLGTIALFESTPAHAQVTISPTSLTFDWVGNGFGDEPWPQLITVTGNGTVSWGSCSGDSVLCNIINEPSFSNNLPVTAPGNLYIRMIGGVGFLTSTGVGTRVSTVTLTPSTSCPGGCNITVTLNTHAPVAPTIATVSGSQAGCSSGTFESGAGTYYGLPNCNFLPDMVPGGTFPQPGVGGSYVDANFGATVKQVTDPTTPHSTICNDSGASNWNSNGTYFCVQSLGGNFSFINAATLVADYTQAQITTFHFWDQTNPNVYYYFDGGVPVIHKCTLGVPPAISCVNQFTYSGAASTITNGNNCNASKDNWVAFWTVGGADQKVGIVNLANPAQTYLSPQYSNALWGGMVHGEACISVGIDSVTGFRYIVRATNGLTGAFGTEGVEILGYCANSTCGGPGTTLVRLNNWPVNPTQVQFPASGSQTPAITFPAFHCDDTCFIAGFAKIGAHGCYVEVSGQQFIQLNIQTGTPFMAWVVLMKESSGDLMYVPAEAGGGTYAQFPIWGFSDTHNSCSSVSPLAGMDTDSDLVQNANTNVPSFLITNATTASPIVVTSSSNYTGANGDSILAAGVKGLSGLNGVWTVGALTGATLNAVGTTGSGTYTGSTGVFTKNIKPPVQPYQNEIMVFDYTHILDGSPSYTVTRLAKARSMPFSQSYTNDSPYYLQSHVNFSPDMTKFNFNSNLGFPDSMAVFMGFTSVAPTNPALTTRKTTWRFSTAR
jgi:hypothetical protein